MKDENRKLIRQKLISLFLDTTAQADTLHVRGDVRWDCYDKNNWYNMTDNILDIAELLNMEIQQDE